MGSHSQKRPYDPGPDYGLETINIEPNYEGMRAWILERVAPSSLADAVRVAAAMGDEAPTLQQIAEAAGLTESEER